MRTKENQSKILRIEKQAELMIGGLVFLYLLGRLWKEAAAGKGYAVRFCDKFFGDLRANNDKKSVENG